MSNDEQEQGTGWQQAAPAAGWYQDPWDSRRRRYWDGQGWTGDVSFEPPGNWGGQPDPGEGQVGYGQVQAPAAAVAPQAPGWPVYPAQPHAPQWPAAQPDPYVTQAGWGGWGQPPHVPAGPWAGGAAGWPPAAAAAPAQPNRVHVAIVAVIAAIAVLAGIGIGSQINNSSPPAAAPSTGNGGGVQGSGGFANPFGGGSGQAPGGGGTSTGGSGSLSGAQRALATKVDRSVVDINTQLSYESGAAAGTGMVLTSGGAILTNNHVIDQATSISVTVVSTGKIYKATVVGTDVTEDVAVLQVQGAPPLTPIAVAPSDVSRGDSVLAIGNAGGAGGTPSVVTGTVRGLNETITASDSNGSNAEVLNGLIQTDAPIQAGDSGGPLVDSRGRVIGMDTAASSSNQVSGGPSVGFAIPIASATTIAAQIQQGKPSDKIHIGQTGFLGVSVQPPANGSGLGQAAPAQEGAAVAGVIPNSPADTAGIVTGDTITAVDGTAIASASSLTTTLRAHHPGDRVAVTWVDTSGQSHTVTVTLTVGPAA